MLPPVSRRHERIVVAGRQFVSARLTPSAYERGLGAIIPKVVMARPAGAKRRQTTIVRVPIRGKAEWLAVVSQFEP